MTDFCEKEAGRGALCSIHGVGLASGGGEEGKGDCDRRWDRAGESSRLEDRGEGIGTCDSIDASRERGGVIDAVWVSGLGCGRGTRATIGVAVADDIVLPGRINAPRLSQADALVVKRLSMYSSLS